MFCKKCGREIGTNVRFCPGCGAAVPPASLSAGLSPAGALSPGSLSASGAASDHDRNSGFRGGGKYIAVMGIILALAVIAAAAFIVLRPKSGEEELPEEEYSVVGTWSSDDMEDLGDIMEDILYDNLLEPLGSSAARSVGEGVDRLLDGLSGEFEIVLRDNGELELYVSGVSLEAVSLSYEIIDKSEMKLTMKFSSASVPLLGSIEIPPISYKAEYFVGKKWLTLDFFGYELEFTRKK